jgi:hypothetical protein
MTGGIVKPRSIGRLASFNLRNLCMFRDTLACRGETTDRLPASILPVQQQGSLEALQLQHAPNLHSQEELQQAHILQQTPSPLPRLGQLSHPGYAIDSVQRYPNAPQPSVVPVPAPVAIHRPALACSAPQAAPVRNTAPIPVVISARPNPNLGRVAGTVLPPMPMPVLATTQVNHVAAPRLAATIQDPVQASVPAPGLQQAVPAQSIAPVRAAVSAGSNGGTGRNRGRWNWPDEEVAMNSQARTSAPLDMAAAQDEANAARQLALDILEEAAGEERSDPNMVAYDREGDPIDVNRVYGNTGR